MLPCPADDMYLPAPTRGSSATAFVDVDLTPAGVSSGPTAVSLASDLESTCSSRFNVANLAVRDSVELVSNAVSPKMNWYTKLLAQHSSILLVILAVFSGACITVSFTHNKLPTFNDPTLGFETRGTDISQRLTAWQNLLESTRPSGPLTLNTADLLPPSTSSPLDLTSKTPTVKGNKRKHKKPDIYVTQSPADNASLPDELTHKKPEKPEKPDIYVTQPPAENTTQLDDLIESDQHKNWTFGINVSEPHQSSGNSSTAWEIIRNKLNEHKQVHDHNHLSHDGFFCGAPGPDFSHFVLTSTDGSDLFALETLRSACALDLLVRRNPHFSDKCETKNMGGNECCHSWALHNYIAAFYGLTDCSQIQEHDVTNFKKLLIECSQYYHSLQLPADCQGDIHDPSKSCFKLPSECFKHNAVYNVMHFIVDTGFIPSNGSKLSTVSHSMLFLPMARSSDAIAFFKALSLRNLIVENVQVSAMDLGIKNQLFDDCLVQDTWLIGLGALCVFLCMWMYTGSLIVTFMTIVAVGLSLGISYFFYTLVFGIKFFPFMNLLACVVAVGIGADDAFVFCKVWECTKDEKRQASLIQLVQESFDHTVSSMFVTSFTTAVAFFASCISPITDIRCFSMFAGMAVVANLFLTVTWLPAVIIFTEKLQCRIGNRSSWNLYFPALQSQVQHFSVIFEKVLVLLVNTIPFVWILILGLIGLASAVLVLWWPGLHLPDSPDLQLFHDSHPFEQYDLVYRDKFRFEKAEQHAAENMPLRFVWGVKPVDNGNYMNPYSKGKLEFDSSFDIGANDSQVWLRNFCGLLKNQSFYLPTSGPQLQNCFIDTLETWMKRRCKDIGSGKSLNPCCEVSPFPYRRSVLRQCTALAMQSIYRSPFGYSSAGPRFSKNITSPKIRAIVVEYESNFPFSMSHQEMHSFYSQVEKWMQNQLLAAPVGMRHGWFVSELRFYDVQHTISGSTISAILVSMALSLVVLLLVTLNVFVSLFAVICITCTVFVTVATLLLLGWQLNVLESVAICTAIGLAVDFSLHYSVSYSLAPDNTNREEAVKFSVKRMAGPTAMGALTTAVAGVFMLPSSVLAYIQIGKFLIILMFVSWTYSTFFLLSLLRVAGPRHGFCQFSYRVIFCGVCKRRSQQSSNISDGAEKSVFDNILSESSLSASSTRHVLQPSTSETHELEALSHAVKRVSQRGQRSGSLSNIRLSQRATTDHSPSAASANTVILCDDVEVGQV